MKRIERRDFLKWSCGAGLGGAGSILASRGWRSDVSQSSDSPAYSVVPVVGDGKWIWTRPPEDESGYLEPRSYSLEVGIELEGTGNAGEVMSTTTVPVAYPEQKIDSVQIKTQGCEAEIRQLTPTAAQLFLITPEIAKGQIIRAVAHYKLTLFKQYFAYERDQFPEKQEIPADVRRGFLQDSPGIQTKIREVRELAASLAKQAGKHPWDLAKAFADWVPRNIKPQLGSYTSVSAALETKRGDCEEMAGVFVALCRAVNIPARLVWIPNHTWAEFFLVDGDKQGHWIPAHTACYSWFGWNGVHELVLQKGDRVQIPERRRQVRLMDDWTRATGGMAPRARYTAELTPLAASEGADAGPGARSKDERGEWKVVGAHPLDHYVRR